MPSYQGHFISHHDIRSVSCLNIREPVSTSDWTIIRSLKSTSPPISLTSIYGWWSPFKMLLHWLERSMLKMLQKCSQKKYVPTRIQISNKNTLQKRNTVLVYNIVLRILIRHSICRSLITCAIHISRTLWPRSFKLGRWIVLGKKIIPIDNHDSRLKVKVKTLLILWNREFIFL